MSADPVSNAILRFETGWKQVLEGVITRGGRLTIEYSPNRLPDCRLLSHGALDWHIQGFVRFHPDGGITRGNLLEEVRAGHGPVTSHNPIPLGVDVPRDTTQLELWFHSFSFIRGSCHAWDSRFGQNYWFEVVGPDPLQPNEPVRRRDGAVLGSPYFVNVIREAASKVNVFPRPAAGPRMGTDLRSFLNVSAWVRNVAFAKNVWIDLHVYDTDANRIGAMTLPLTWSGSQLLLDEMGDVFRFEGEIYRGSNATPGSVTPRPDARYIQFRLYYEVSGTVFTDDILHQLDLPEDAVST
jgi:Family of unknown function (DUF6209)